MRFESGNEEMKVFVHSSFSIVSQDSLRTWNRKEAIVSLCNTDWFGNHHASEKAIHFMKVFVSTTQIQSIERRRKYLIFGSNVQMHGKIRENKNKYNLVTNELSHSSLSLLASSHAFGLVNLKVSKAVGVLLINIHW